MDESSGWPTAARGAAWRRRQRRLRSMQRHERQSFATELAAALHHSCGGELGTNVGLRAQKAASAGPAEHFELSSDDGRPAGGERPAALLEPRPQERVQRHTVEHLADLTPMVQILDVPVPQVVDQLVAVLEHCDNSVAEHIIEVPKISWPSRPLRAVLSEPQMAEC